jgi:hypothetical protein
LISRLSCCSSSLIFTVFAASFLALSLCTISRLVGSRTAQGYHGAH